MKQDFSDFAQWTTKGRIGGLEVATKYNLRQPSVAGFQAQYTSFSKALMENLRLKDADSQYVQSCSGKYNEQEDFLRLSKS
jgi:hypothetical protein